MVASVFDVVADPVRRGILELLTDGELPAGHIASAFPTVTREAVSHHLQVLKGAGLVADRRDAQRRLYRLEARPLREIDDWLGRYRAFWDDRLDALAQHLEAPRR